MSEKIERVNARIQLHQSYQDVIAAAKDGPERLYVVRRLALEDLFFLLVYVCNMTFLDNDWAYDRCAEVQQKGWGYLHLWAREHLKSTIVTFGLSLQTVLRNPEETIGILSFSRPIAKQFLRQIKREMEENAVLQALFPDVLWARPKSEAPTWSENEGIIVKRHGNPKEATIEAYGLTDGQPTSKHWTKVVYDDAVHRASVTNVEQIEKTTRSWAESLNLGARGGSRMYVGTYWHHADTYHVIEERGVPVVLHPATHNGLEDGTPVFLTREELQEKRREMGRYVFSCQILLHPQPESLHGFDVAWMRTWSARRYGNLNLYILCDPASSKKRGSDYTVMTVIGLGSDRNYYIISWVRARMNLTERARTLIKLHQDYQPVAVGYEQYGLQADIEHIESVQEQINYRFSVTAVGGQLAKPERVERLIPDYEQGRWYLPESCVRTNEEGEQVDLRGEYQREYEDWPFPLHDDMLDCQSRIYDLGALFPAGDDRNALGVGRASESRKQEYDPMRFGLGKR